MVTKELIDYIANERRAGVPQEKIINDLKREGGWSTEDIMKAFSLTASSVPQAVPSVPQGQPVVETPTQAGAPQVLTAMEPESVTTPSECPRNVKIFEVLMYIAVLLNVVSLLMGRVLFYRVPDVLPPMGSVPLNTTSIISVVLTVLFTYLAARKRMNWARILTLLSILFSYSLPILLILAGVTKISIKDTFAFVAFALQVTALYQVFTPKAEVWFKLGKARTYPGSLESVSNNRKWSTIIPLLNHVTLVIALLLIFTVDLQIIKDDPSLMLFFYLMLTVLGLFVPLYILESFVLNRRYKYTKSSLDGIFLIFVILRNIVIILNVIPFIQLIGLVALGYGMFPYAIFYLVLLAKRKTV